MPSAPSNEMSHGLFPVPKKREGTGLGANLFKQLEIVAPNGPPYIF